LYILWTADTDGLESCGFLKGEAVFFFIPLFLHRRGKKTGVGGVDGECRGEKRKHKTCPIAWLNAKARHSQFGLCAEA